LVPLEPFVRQTIKQDLPNNKALETKELSYATLRQAATRGRLDATIGTDGMWHSTKDAVEKYLQNKYKRT
jgi:predicted site-specific integrase-resolvase